MAKKIKMNRPADRSTTALTMSDSADAPVYASKRDVLERGGIPNRTGIPIGGGVPKRIWAFRLSCLLLAAWTIWLAIVAFAF